MQTDVPYLVLPMPIVWCNTANANSVVQWCCGDVYQRSPVEILQTDVPYPEVLGYYAPPGTATDMGIRYVKTTR